MYINFRESVEIFYLLFHLVPNIVPSKQNGLTDGRIFAGAY